MAARSHFLELPRELRDMIYDDYLLEPGGYHYRHSSGKLCTSSGQPIDLALIYTCKSIAAEMSGLALTKNVLNFSTVPLGDESWMARDFDNALEEWYEERFELKQDILNLKDFLRSDPVFPKFKKAYQALDDLVALKYQRIDPYGVAWLGDDIIRRMGTFEGSWLYREFLRDSLGVLTMSTDVLEFKSREIPQGAYGRLPMGRFKTPFVRSSYLTFQPASWDIPTEEEIRDMNQYVTRDPKKHDTGRPSWRYSAAAAAIQFLGSLCCEVMHIRNVLLHEDHPSVANPECHAMGLIRFCRQNPKLRITRKVNFWSAMMVSSVTGGRGVSSTMRASSVTGGRGTNCLFNEEGGLMINHDEDYREFDMECVVYAFSQWVAEARSLFLTGMPAESFSLVFDGDPIPKQSSEAFEMIKEEAAWQAAQQLHFDKQSVEPLTQVLHGRGVHFCTDFDKIVSEMIAGTSFISCNFPLGDPYDAPSLCQILEARCGSEKSWIMGWAHCRRGMRWRLFPPQSDRPDFKLEAVGYISPDTISPNSFS